jgi:hypothetical protein
MIKHLSQISGVAAFAVIASTASAEVKINDYLALEGYATGAAVVTEPSAGKSAVLLDSGRIYDSTVIALNGKYEAFTSKVSLLGMNSSKNSTTADMGLLDAYVTYTTGAISVTGGQFNGWLGYESFDTIVNPFIDFGAAGYGYIANRGTGAKIEYAVKDYSTGVSVRDSINAGDKFMGGDGDFSDDLGYEAYFTYKGIDKLTLFVGAGYQDTEGAAKAVTTYSSWAAYALSEKVTLVGEYASTFNSGSAAGDVSCSYTALATYAFTSEFALSARVGVNDSKADNYLGYGLAPVYTLTKNFSIKGDISKKDNQIGTDSFTYALQGIFKF